MIRSAVIDDPQLLMHFRGARRAPEKIVDHSLARAANATLGPFVIESRRDRMPGRQ